MKKIIICILFLVIALFICIIAPNYILEEMYDKDEVRVVLNEIEITHNDRKMPQKALIVDGAVMLSQDTVDILFDKWLYYDKKYDTIITTSNSSVAKLKLGEKKISINDNDFEIEVPAQIIDEIIYIPIEKLQDVYDITVSYNDKVVITTSTADYIKTTLGKKLKIHAYKKSFSKVISTCMSGEEVDVFGFRDNPDWVIVRRNNGDLGYAKMTSIVSENMEANMFRPIELPMPKVNFVWEYAEFYTPNRSGESKIDSIAVVAPTWIYFKNSDGELKNSISEEYIKWAHNNNYKVWATFKNDYIGIDNTSKMITDMKIRERIISNLIDLSKKFNLDGINVDFENMKKEDVEEFSQFIRELSAMLRLNNITVSVDVNVPDGSDNWSLCYNHYQIADVADYLVVMTYDQYGSSSTVPGSTAELSWVENNVKKLVERDGIKEDKIIIGIPLYSRLWKIENEKVSKSTINMKTAKSYMEKGKQWLEEEGQYYVEFEDGGAKYMLWVEDENSAKEKLKLIDKYNLAGAAYWVRGQETDDFWEKIK